MSGCVVEIDRPTKHKFRCTGVKICDPGAPICYFW